MQKLNNCTVQVHGFFHSQNTRKTKRTWKEGRKRHFSNAIYCSPPPPSPNNYHNASRWMLSGERNRRRIGGLPMHYRMGQLLPADRHRHAPQEATVPPLNHPPKCICYCGLLSLARPAPPRPALSLSLLALAHGHYVFVLVWSGLVWSGLRLSMATKRKRGTLHYDGPCDLPMDRMPRALNTKLLRSCPTLFFALSGPAWPFCPPAVCAPGQSTSRIRYTVYVLSPGRGVRTPSPQTPP